VARFDRYLLGELLRVFGFFSLILVLVYWVNRAVGLFDRLIGDGQTALVFLEFSLLTIPNVVRIVLPVSAFAATVYVANRLSQDGELTVMQATGFSGFRLARPVMTFGLIVTGLVLILSNSIVPLSRAQLAERQAEVSANVTARLLQDGRFNHPSDGLTFYIREISETGELLDVFLADDRSAANRTTYTARRAFLVRTATGPKLVMFDGMSQTLRRDSGRLAVTHFADFTYDLSGLLDAGGRAGLTIEELPTRQLFAAPASLLAVTGQTAEAFRSEAHGRIAQPFLALAAPLIGFAALLLGGFSRFGLWRQIGAAIVLLILLQSVNNAAVSASLRAPQLWAMSYLAPSVGCALAAVLLWTGQRPRRLRAAGAGA
jgi:lipopolysaccharide export system permease protein